MAADQRSSGSWCLASPGQVILASHWSIMLILFSDWSIMIIQPSHWSIMLILPSDWSEAGSEVRVNFEAVMLDSVRERESRMWIHVTTRACRREQECQVSQGL